MMPQYIILLLGWFSQNTQLCRMYTVGVSVLASGKKEKPPEIGYQSAAGPQLHVQARNTAFVA